MLENQTDNKYRERFEELFAPQSTSDTTNYITSPEWIKEKLFKWFLLGLAEAYKEKK